MPLKRVTDQKLGPIEEAYAVKPNTDSPLMQGINEAMTAIINKLNHHFPNQTIYCLTSHERIVLVNEDTWQSRWYVTFVGHSTTHYFIEYRMTTDLSPWERAYVKGEAKSPEQALEYILIAMKNSKGWEE